MAFLKKSSWYKYLRLKSIKAKFLAIVLPSAITIFLVISVSAGYLSYHDMKNNILAQAERNAKSYSKPLGVSLWNLNVGVIDSQINAMLNNPDIAGVKVVENLGHRIFLAGDVPQLKNLDDYLESTITISHTVYNEPEVLGKLYLYSKKKQIYQTLLKRFFRDALLFFILVVTIILSALYANHKIIMIPMRKLIESIHRYNTNKELKPAAWAADDEMGQIIAAYNGLIISVDMGNTQVRSALEKAREANTVKGQFLANMSHEIRTPLNGIMGMADLLVQTDLSLEQRELASTVHLESESLLCIINDILDFSKMEAGKLQIEQIEFDLRYTLENLCAGMSVNADNKGIELIHFLDPAAPTRLIGDPGRLRQVFSNLIGNAIKFTHEGEVLVKGELIHKFEQKAAFRFIVEDTGVGIPAADQDRIFDSFSQADGSTTRKYGGTGLGITIAKMLVEKMGGTIGLFSNPDKGTQFWFEIELFRQPPQRRPQQKEEAQFSTLGFLLLDDIKTRRVIISKYLEFWGCRTIISITGDLALEELKNLEERGPTIDVILIDYSMPEMNDFKLADTIRQHDAYKDIPIIVLAAMGKLGDARLCKSAGVSAYLTKPVRSGELKAVINRLLCKSVTPDTSATLITRHTLAEERRKNITVLLAEDYVTNQKVALKQLEMAGFNVMLANNGKEAVQLFEKHAIDAVLMDIQMPVMDGYEATGLIRKMEKDGRHTPVIAMTAHAIKGYRQECLKAGMDDYITKPVKRDTLISTVSKWIQGRPQSTTYNYYTGHTRKEPQDAVIDFEKGIAEFEGDRVFFLAVLDEFIGTVDKQLSKIRDGLRRDQFVLVAKEAHAIKGGAANLTALALSKAAARLEKKVKKDIPKDLDEAYAGITQQYQRLKVSRVKEDLE